MSSGRHSGGSHIKNSKFDSAFKKYRPLVPASLSDSELLDLLRKCNNSDGVIGEEIQALWDKEAESRHAEDEFCVVEKKSKKKETPAAPVERGRRSKNSERINSERASKSGKSPQFQASTLKSLDIAHISKRNETLAQFSADSFPGVNTDSSIITEVQCLNSTRSSAVTLNSVWGGGSSLAQKIKTAEKLNGPSVVEPQDPKKDKTAGDSNENQNIKPALKSRSRKEKKGQHVSRSNGKSDNAVDTSVAIGKDISVEEQAVSSVMQSVTSEPATSVAESNSGSSEKAAYAPTIVVQSLSNSAVQKVINVSTTGVVDDSSANYVNLGKWATSTEPFNESGFQFGNFGGDSEPVPAESTGGSSDRNQKTTSKNSSWKDSKKHSSNSRQGTNTDSSWPPASDNASASNDNGVFDESSNNTIFSAKSSGRQNTDTSGLGRVQSDHNTTSGPPGLVAQNLDAGRVSQVNASHRSNGTRKANEPDQSGKQHTQTAPPGINQRAAVGTGFGGIMPGGMVPTVPYGSVPYDISHQAPSLHPTGTYGTMQQNFSGAAATLSSSQNTSTTSAPSSVTNATSTSQTTLGSTVVANSSSQHQPAYQSTPPGMPAYIPYSYNPPYYGHQFYYGGQPPPFYNRGQPMYQQPRSMYGGEAYGSGAHGVGGYPDMYGSQGTQFNDSHYGGNMHHHGSSVSERGGKQKNPSGPSSNTSQQPAAVVAESHPHTSYPGYGGSYSNRDGQGQYQYQGWTTAPMMYPQASPPGVGVPVTGNFQAASGRGQYENSSKNSGSGGHSLNGSSYSGSQYVSAGRGGGSSAASPAQSTSAVPGSNLQPGGW